MISRELQTVPIIIEDPRYEDTFVIMFSPEVGAEFRVIVCHTEDQANGYMREYERSGTMTVTRGYMQNIKDVFTPIVAMKLRTVGNAMRTEYRAVRVEDPKIIDPTEILSSEVND